MQSNLRGGDPIDTKKLQRNIIAAGMCFNFLLFGVKLYVGLSANSICIWSDAMNNLADALSCLLSLAFVVLVARLGNRLQSEIAEKGEQLLSFLLSLVVAIVGVSFAWSSLERLIYPTPVWFSLRHFLIVLLTVLAKLGMYFFYRTYAAKTRSGVLRVMQADSLMDCFITTATLLSFTLTRWFSFAVDAVFGLCISVFLFVGAAKLLRIHLRALLGLVPRELRDRVASCISSGKGLANYEKIQYYIGDDNAVTAFVFTQPDALEEEAAEALARLAAETMEQTGVQLRFVLSVPETKITERGGSASAGESHA